MEQKELFKVTAIFSNGFGDVTFSTDRTFNNYPTSEELDNYVAELHDLYITSKEVGTLDLNVQKIYRYVFLK